MSYYGSGYTPVETQILAVAYALNQRVLAGLIKDALVAGGWTLAAEMGSRNLLVATGLPSNTQTYRPDSGSAEIYTFKTVINNGTPREVLIGANAYECLQNLLHAINDDGTGKGTLYSTATAAAHATVVASMEYHASYSSATLMVQIASQGSTLSGTETMSNASISSTKYAGWMLKSGVTPAGHRATVLVMWDAGIGWIRFEAYANHDFYQVIRGTTTWARKQGAARAICGGAVGDDIPSYIGHTYVVKTTPYWFTIHVHNTTGQNNTFFHIPKVTPGAEPLTVTAATNTSPIEITVSEPHGWLTGEQVSIDHCLGNDGANGDWTITKVSDYTFTLDGSAGTGVYTADGLCGGPDRTVRLLIGTGSNSFRTQADCGDEASIWVINQFALNTNLNAVVVLGEYPSGDESREFLGQRNMIIAPEIRGPHGSLTSSTSTWLGHLWDSFAVNLSHTRDITTIADGKEWKCFGATTNWSLWMMEEGEEA